MSRDIPLTADNQNKQMMHAEEESLEWIEVPKEGDPWQLPKGVEEGTSLLLTRQAKDVISKLQNRKGMRSVVENLTILSGPSGIGKSCLALATTLFMRAQEKENILYVPDAGELLEKARRAGAQKGMALSRSLVEFLLRLTFAQNSEQVTSRAFPDGSSSADLSMDEFVSRLNDHNFIVIIDEQGHAYMDLEQENDSYSFGMIYPNFYKGQGDKLRVVLTGSNQSSFEVSLNGTYRSCLRFVEPLAKEEAIAFNEQCDLKLNDEDIGFYCNNVPREMVLLSKAVKDGHSRDSHIKNRSADFTARLMRAYGKRNISDKSIASMVPPLLFP